MQFEAQYINFCHRFRCYHPLLRVYGAHYLRCLYGFTEFSKTLTNGCFRLIRITLIKTCFAPAAFFPSQKCIFVSFYHNNTITLNALLDFLYNDIGYLAQYCYVQSTRSLNVCSVTPDLLIRRRMVYQCITKPP